MPRASESSALDAPRERLLADGPRSLSIAELVALLVGTGTGRVSARAAAVALVEAVPLPELAWAPPAAMASFPGIGPARAAAIAAAFELGRRGAWSPPQRGQRCLDPRTVHELMRHVAYAEREIFHVVLLDVRGRLLRSVKIAEGSLSQCPVSPRDALRPAVREGAHGIVFCHNHQSGVMRSAASCGAVRAFVRGREIPLSFRPHDPVGAEVAS